jgi:VWFA-related protein
MSLRILVLLPLLTLCPQVAAAQPDDPLPRPTVVFPEWQPTFKATTTLVTIDAVVTDAEGRHVTNLTADDFEVVQRRRRRALRQVAYVPLVSAAAPLTVSAPAAEAAALPPSSSPALSLALAPEPKRITRTVAVVVDDLGLSFESTVAVRRALYRFVDEHVRPGDLVAVLRTSGGIGALQQFTTDRRLLREAIDRVQWTVLSRSGVSAFAAVAPSSGLDADPEDATRRDIRESTPQQPEVGAAYAEDSEQALRDSVLASGTLGALEFVVRGVQHLPGRKAIVFVSEGFDLFNRKGQAKIYSAFTRLMDRANRAGVVVYTIDGRGLETGRLNAEDNPQPRRLAFGIGGNDGDKTLRELILGHQARRQAVLRNTEEALHFLAWQTGGLAFLNSNDLAGGMRRVLADLRGYYLLGFDAPDDATLDWYPGDIEVRVKRPGLTVRWRQGYFGPADPNERPQPVGDALTGAALSPFGTTGITVRQTALFGHDAAAGAYVRSLLFIDANTLHFDRNADGRHDARVEVLQIAVGENGAVLAQWRRTLTFSLDEAQLRDARLRGIVYGTRMAVTQPGGYQVRLAVQDLATGAVGSASQFLEVPPVGRGRLAVSGVLLKAHNEGRVAEAAGPSAEREIVTEVLGAPSVRVFEPGSDVVYAYEIYDGLRGGAAERTVDVHEPAARRPRALREPVDAGRAAAEAQAPRVIPIAGQLSLGADVPPGAYTLQVSVGSGGKRRAAQWVDLEVRQARELDWGSAAPLTMTSWTARTIVTHDGTTRTTRSDHVATEEPLEVRVNGEPYAITMRTPG